MTERIYTYPAERKKKGWGELKNTRHSFSERNKAIFAGYSAGISVERLASEYYLSPKTVYKILSKIKNEE